jgi:hypothetical protein
MSQPTINSNIAVRTGINTFTGSNSFEHLPYTTVTVQEQKDSSQANILVTREYVNNRLNNNSLLYTDNNWLGTNVFTNAPQCSIAPTDGSFLTNKKYVDDAATAGSVTDAKVSSCVGLNKYAGTVIGSYQTINQYLPDQYLAWTPILGRSVSQSYNTFRFQAVVNFASLGLPNLPDPNYKVYVQMTNFQLPEDFPGANSNFLAFTSFYCYAKKSREATEEFTVVIESNVLTTVAGILIINMPKIDIDWAISSSFE